MSEKKITFRINGTEWDEDSLMVVIPHLYKSWFHGKNFRDMKHFGTALMYASCAAEAGYYKKYFRMEQDELELRRQLSLY